MESLIPYTKQFARNSTKIPYLYFSLKEKENKVRLSNAYVLQTKLHFSNLSLSVDSNDAICCFVWCRYEDGVSTDAVHVDAGSGLDVIQVDVAVLSYQKRHPVLLAGLKTLTIFSKYLQSVVRQNQTFKPLFFFTCAILISNELCFSFNLKLNQDVHEISVNCLVIVFKDIFGSSISLSYFFQLVIWWT